MKFSNTGDEADIILEPCVPYEMVCMRWSTEIPDEYFYFYPGVIEDF